MLVSFLSDNLQKTITFLNHAVSLRNQLPILSNFKIEAKDGKLILSATDLEIGIVSSIAANIEEEGQTTVPAKTFFDFISSVGSQKLTLQVQESTLNLKGSRIKASFPTSPPDDFPSLFEKKGEKLLELEKGDIEKFLTRVSFAAAIDSSRPALSGILIDSQKDGLLFVATDSYRLSFQKTALKTKDQLEKPIVVPARLVKELMFLKEEGMVEVFFSQENNQILFFQKDTVLVGRLIDAQFPAFEKIIPQDFNTKTQVGREELLNAIKICSIFARETANIVKIAIEKEKITVSANSPSVGEDTVEIDAKTTGEENEIAFNAKYLIDILSVLEDEEVIFEMNGPLNPGVFRIPGDKGFFHLIMPIRVQS